MWDGFSEDDINRLKAGQSLQTKGREQSPAVPVPKRQSSHLRGSAKKNVARERMLQRPYKPSEDVVKLLDSIPENARLSKPKNTENRVSSDLTPPVSDICKETENNAKAEISNNDSLPLPNATDLPNDKKINSETNPNQGPVCIKIKEGKNYEVMSSDKTPLDEFQSRHKLMEEQNKRRKELLAKALADRKKQTTAEAKRLQQIQDELQKLDVLLSNDVGILRNQIEAASLEFMDAQKRYDKAEKEFLEAKLHLFSKLERKELLTEHLCKIIEQNELRKAKKLSELMDKLDLGSSTEKLEDEQKNTIGPAILPTLCALDDISYAACNTLKSRRADNVPSVVSSVEESKSPSSNLVLNNIYLLEGDSQNNTSSPKVENEVEAVVDSSDNMNLTEQVSEESKINLT